VFEHHGGDDAAVRTILCVIRSWLKIDSGLRMKENIVKDKSFAFALRVVKLAKYLESEKREFVLSRQVLRSGTAVGALVREAEHAESRADFIHKMSIALKEANETLYWLDLLHQGEYIDAQTFKSIGSDSEELIKLLTAIVKSSKVTRQ
jgi:four helix bundle protein